jgi:hypothetical protein
MIQKNEVIDQGATVRPVYSRGLVLNSQHYLIDSILSVRKRLGYVLLVVSNLRYDCSLGSLRARNTG